MTMNKTYLTPAVLVTLLITGCGLKGDLYIPAEQPVVVPAGTQSTEDQNDEVKSSEKKSTEEKLDRTLDQTP